MRLARTVVFASGVAVRRYARPAPEGPADLSSVRTELPAPPDGWRPVPGRVLHVVTNALPERNAGYTVRTHRIVAAQRSIGLDAHVVTRLGFPVAQGRPDVRDLRRYDGVPYHRLVPWWPRRDPAAHLAAGARRLTRLVRDLRPAVLHAATDHHNGQVALAAGARFGIPVLYEVRGFLEESWLAHDPARTRDDPRFRVARELETRCMLGADLVVTLGAAMREEIVARGVDPDRVWTVPNAVDEEFLAPPPDPAPLRAAYGFGDDTLVVGTTSSFYRFEGLDVLLDAVADLRARDVPIRALLVGDGPERGALQRRARELGVDDVTYFTGRVPASEVRQYHAILDVFVVPRRNERVCQLVTPLKPIEAMASGLPVIASDVKALREIVEPQMTSTLIPPEDSAALAKCLAMLAYAPERGREIGRRARLRISRDNTWVANARRYRSAYEFITQIT
ncbi:MAG TPA: glycosyltransferase [Streptosporangiaceae bacterium]|jgi:glycosyltransferase involved in cell wall biosynthesis